MKYFFDTSAFAKFYCQELGSDRVTAIFREIDASFQISNLVFVETQSAFAMKVRTGALDLFSAEKAMSRGFKDIESGLVIAAKLDESHLTAARFLVGKYGFTRRLRTLDAIQLAVALDLHRRGLSDLFVVADKLLAEVAALEGLAVENPEAEAHVT